MESLKELYRVGPGPSSSHTLAIQRICRYYLKKHPDDSQYTVTLYGSLALTGKGHGTDKIIYQTLGEKRTTIIMDPRMKDDHANTLTICSGNDEMTFYSIGGGAFAIKGVPHIVDEYVYPQSTMEGIEKYCDQHACSLVDYVSDHEPDIRPFLQDIFQHMMDAVDRGLQQEGVLPGALKLERVARRLYKTALSTSDPVKRRDLLVSAYAYACAEENADGGTVVTAPTMGSCGVMPAVLRYYRDEKKAGNEQLVNALAVAGIFGNLVKTNASISGAEGGCQAEIGTACAMAAAASAYLEGQNIPEIAYAAEIGIEHNLGLTCDPVGGYVMIPCIERNGVAALRALDAAVYAGTLGQFRRNRVSFDMVVTTMNYTGKKIARELRETSLGGLAEVVK